MKKLGIILLALTPACHTLGELMDVPSAVVQDVGGAVDVVTPDDQAAAETAGSVAQTGTTLLTGNAALGAGAGALVTTLVLWLRKKKKPAA